MEGVNLFAVEVAFVAKLPNMNAHLLDEVIVGRAQSLTLMMGFETT